MPIQHAKSPCCQGVIYSYGSRRRQCASCLRTWRIRPKKRGRKRLRVDARYATRYLVHDLPPLSHLTLKGRVSEAQLKRRLHYSRAQILRTSLWQAPPSDIPLVAIADAVWQWINKVRYTLYLILLKPLLHTEAIICLPLLKEGEETSGWPDAFRQLPQEWRERVFALICDGNVGMISYARHHGWMIQRCHAHLRRYLTTISAAVLRVDTESWGKKSMRSPPYCLSVVIGKKWHGQR